MAKFAMLVVAVLSACAIEQPPDLEPVFSYCPRFGCGTNTATGPDGLVFDELNWNGEPNENGVRIKSAVLSNNTPVTLSAITDHLIATTKDGTMYEGIALTSMIITLSHVEGTEIEVLVYKVYTNGIRFWAGDTTEGVDVYVLKARMVGDDEWFPHTVCAGESLGSEPWPLAADHYAVIFADDRYNAKRKEVYSSIGEPLLNIACAGSYPAKMHLLRHTHAGSFSRSSGVQEWPTSVGQRQAMLKALVADYRGDGKSNTITGLPLRYQDTAGVRIESPPLGYGDSIEAIWNQSGAVCLVNPRLYPRESIDPKDAIPLCEVAHWQAPERVVTAIPL